MWEKQNITVTNMWRIYLKVIPTVKKTPRKVHPEGTSLNIKQVSRTERKDSLTVEEAEAPLPW